MSLTVRHHDAIARSRRALEKVDKPVEPAVPGSALRALVDAVQGLDAGGDTQPYDAWDAAKWTVFNAAVRLVKVDLAALCDQVNGKP